MNFNTSMPSSYIIDYFNSMRLYSVVEKNGEKGKILTIKRITLSENDITVEKIQILKKQLDAGRILLKTGSNKNQTAKYAGKGFDLKQIERIEVQKTFRTDNINKEALEQISEAKISLIEKVVNALNERFGNVHQEKAQPRSYGVRTQPKLTKEGEKFEVTSSTKGTISRTPGELKRKRAQLDEEINEENRATKRQRTEESQELDEVSDARRLKDVRHDEKQEEIQNEDLKNSSKKRNP